MALSQTMMREACQFIKPGHRVASMGYPDIVAPMGEVSAILGERVKYLTYRDDSEAICKRHGLEQHPVPNAESFFSLLGAQLDVFDVVAERGCEIITDLNYPVEIWLRGSYDIVLDVGTLEHCFNIAQAGINMAGMLKAGGVIFHENPFNWGNHGFYGLNPTWYADFYGQLGFVLSACCLLGKDGSGAMVPTTQRFQFTSAEANVFAVAKRVEILEIGFPIQTKYKKLIGAQHG